MRSRTSCFPGWMGVELLKERNPSQGLGFHRFQTKLGHAASRGSKSDADMLLRFRRVVVRNLPRNREQLHYAFSVILTLCKLLGVDACSWILAGRKHLRCVQ